MNSISYFVCFVIIFVQFSNAQTLIENPATKEKSKEKEAFSYEGLSGSLSEVDLDSEAAREIGEVN